MKSKQYTIYGLYLFIAIIVISAFVQLFLSRSLWLDEAMLARSIVRYDYGALSGPLLYGQVAPLFFLYIEKAFVLLVEPDDLALRIFPLICYVLSIYFLFKLSMVLFKDRFLSVLSCVFFCLSPFIFSYSSECKQYMSDVCVCLIITYVVQSYLIKRNFTYPFVALIGTVSIFFSNIAMLTLAINGLLILLDAIKRKSFKELVVISLAWAASFGLYFILMIYHNPAKDNMITYWSSHLGFLSHDYFSTQWKLFFDENILGAYSQNFFSRRGLLFFSIGSIAYLFYQKKYKIVILLIGPVILHLVLSYFQAYPFSGRLTLYLLPDLIIVICFGITEILSRLSKYFNGVAYYLIIPGCLFLGYRFYLHFPKEVEEMKKSVGFMNANRKPGDIVYVSYNAIPVFNTYQDMKDEKFHNPVVTGLDLDRTEEYATNGKQLDSLHGRVWYIFSHYDENEFITYLVNHNKATILQSAKYTGSSAYLIKNP